MKKFSLFFIIFIFVIGCTSSEYPDVPGTPGEARSSAPLGQATSAALKGYAPAYSIFEFDARDNFLPIFTIGLGETSIDFETIVIQNPDDPLVINVNVNQKNGFIWHEGYYWSHSEKLWKKYRMLEDPIEGTGFIRDTSSSNLVINPTHINTDDKYNFILAYSCKKYPDVGNDFKCGCSGKRGPCGQWMMHYYKAVKKNIPEIPNEPTLLCQDSDGGKDFFLLGETYGPSNIPEMHETKVIDFCLNDNELREYYCNKDVVVDNFDTTCDNGCSGGVCIEQLGCTEGETVCDGLSVKKCSGGQFNSIEDCSSACTNGKCTISSSCSEGEIKCTSAFESSTCTDGVLISEDCNNGFCFPGAGCQELSFNP